MGEDKPDPPSDRLAVPPVFAVIQGGGPSLKAHRFVHEDGFVCLRLDYPEPSRAQLRVVDESYEPDLAPPEKNPDLRF